MDNNSESTSRRQFLVQAGAGAALVLAGATGMSACSSVRSVSHIQGRINGANHQLGHKLRSVAELMKLPISEELSTDVLIVGGGVAGLSARRWLQKQGVQGVLLLEMASQTGGNSAYGQNDVSAYPLGAHYLPIPDVRNRDLLQFLEECSVITGYDEQKLPVYNDYFLCHDPQERLFINGLWQEGLVPDTGLDGDDKQQLARFFGLIDQLKLAKGADGRDAFVIPLDETSADEQFRALDRISFDSYLTRQGFTSPYLRWYLNYSCRDDYGATLANTSAWAGLHYFASRKGQAANANAASVLTWPQGNGFLADQLRNQANSPIQSSQLAYEVLVDDSGVTIRTYDAATNTGKVVKANRVILAIPQFITQRLLASADQDRTALTGFQYAPWVVANLTVSALPQGRGLPLCWDNVLYDTASVGYINANQQDLNESAQKVITYYKPLTDTAPESARQAAYTTTIDQWVSQIMDELELAHPGVTAYVSQADIWLWGHGMIMPTPGFIWGNNRRKAAQPLKNRIFFAHSDLSGISIFEEAFYQGIRAAREVVGSV